ncbi:hypothetical protein Acsp02_62220 [Actinoplanes sp. NBRC 103695]|nr:hypothetical protein Acsp02_62220 [Actinoplanes sp. NBRC 103695]
MSRLCLRPCRVCVAGRGGRIGRDPATPRPRDPATPRPRDPATPRPRDPATGLRLVRSWSLDASGGLWAAGLGASGGLWAAGLGTSGVLSAAELWRAWRAGRIRGLLCAGRARPAGRLRCGGPNDPRQ